MHNLPGDSINISHWRQANIPLAELLLSSDFKMPLATHHEVNGGGEVKLERDGGLNHLHF